MTGIVYVTFLVLLVVAAVIDARTLRIPNKLVAALAGLWLAWRMCLAAGGVFVGADFVAAFFAPAPLLGVSFADSILGCVALGGGLLLVTAIFEAVTKRHAMGGGDIKLLGAVGLFLGLERGFWCLLVACVSGVVIALVYARLCARKSSRVAASDQESSVARRSLPFGPAIAIGSAAALALPLPLLP